LQEKPGEISHIVEEHLKFCQLRNNLPVWMRLKYTKWIIYISVITLI